MTIKIVDNTFISACLSEIKCVDLLKISTSYYNFSTTPEIHQETVEGFKGDLVKETYKNIKIFEVKHKKYLELKIWLENRYPQIDSGEISAFLLALLNFDLKDINYYFITDDKKMKKTIAKLNEDPIFMSKLGLARDMNNFNVTGTIGFIKHLIEKDLILNSYIEPIITDMENNGFYIDEGTKNYLRGIK